MLETATDAHATALAETLVRSWREEQNGVIALPGAARQTVDFRLCLSELRDQIVASSGSTAAPSLTFTSVAMPVPFAVASDLGILIHQLVTDAMACARAQGRGGRIAVDLAAVADRWTLGVSEAGFRPAAEGRGAVLRLAAAMGERRRVRLRFPAVVGGMRCVVTLAGPGGRGMRTPRPGCGMVQDHRPVGTGDGAIAGSGR